MKKTITFKSTQENWRKEYLGLKCNTVRVFDNKDDLRKELLEDFILCDLNLLCVEIENCDTVESFTRMVSDVTEFNGVYIISWRGAL